MDIKFEEYLENQKKLNDLKGEYLQAGLEDSEIIDRMREVSQKQRIIYNENQEILKDKYYCYLENSTLFDENSFLELQEFALSLSDFLNQADTGISYEIHSFLHKKALESGDINHIIEESYYHGLVLFYLDDRRFYDELVSCFKTSIDNIDKYFSLKKETRKLFNRSLGNYFIAINKDLSKYDINIDVAMKIIDFWKSDEVVSLDLDFPFYRWEFVTKRNICSLIDYFKLGYCLDNIDIINKVYESASYCFFSNQSVVKDTAMPVSSYISYLYYAASYYAKKITLEELCDNLSLLSTALEDKFSIESRTRVMRIGSSLIFYLQKLDEQGSSRVDLIKATISSIDEYIKSMPVSSFEKVVNKDVAQFIEMSLPRMTGDEVFDQILNSTAYRHFPTYVHVNMVAQISKELLNFAISYNPHYFIGYFDIHSEEEVLEKKEFLLDSIYKAGLLHDVGKFFVNDYISNFGRKLTNREYEIIKEHPEKGYNLLKRANLPSIYTDVALYHHKYFDNSGGYPEEYDNSTIENKPFVDIVTLADCIDAATDQFGRPYSKTKTFNDLLNEFDDGAGTKYSGLLVMMLHQDDVKAKISHLIGEVRREVTVSTIKLFANDSGVTKS
ncbi:MAG: HD domain-containing protein [Acholeplasmatales bacterium]|jgi:HD-GYP domain-containing protein (c-di-GMP phosphodiesterase class II)|nr:HD domain-containing protein [Acholeplasmatales bacterium]